MQACNSPGSRSITQAPFLAAHLDAMDGYHPARPLSGNRQDPWLSPAVSRTFAGSEKFNDMPIAPPERKYRSHCARCRPEPRHERRAQIDRFQAHVGRLPIMTALAWMSDQLCGERAPLNLRKPPAH